MRSHVCMRVCVALLLDYAVWCAHDISIIWTNKAWCGSSFHPKYAYDLPLNMAGALWLYWLKCNKWSKKYYDYFTYIYVRCVVCGCCAVNYVGWPCFLDHLTEGICKCSSIRLSVCVCVCDSVFVLHLILVFDSPLVWPRFCSAWNFRYRWLNVQC